MKPGKKTEKPEIIQQKLLNIITEILLIHGTDLSQAQYNKIEYSGKPSISTLYRHIGDWDTVKMLATQGNTPNVPTEVFKSDNEKLMKQLVHQRNMNAVIIEHCLKAISGCSFSPAKVPKPERVLNEQEFFAMKSDDHCGEIVDPAWVQGVSEYNSNIFKERLEIWTQKVLTFRDQDKKSLGLNKLVLNFLGDHVTGETVFKGQAFFIDLCVIDQLLLCVEQYTSAILALAESFPKIEIFCVQGNHGRIGKKGDNHPRSNFDYLFFRMLQTALRLQPNVKVFVNESPTMIVKHGNFVFCLNHNDDTRGWNGIPYYGLDRKARRLGDLYGMMIHYKLGGHFHSPANLNDETLLNGTMVGGSDLSVNSMRVATRPSQKIFYFDREHGIHRESNLYLADKTVLTADDNGIFTSYVE